MVLWCGGHHGMVTITAPWRDSDRSVVATTVPWHGSNHGTVMTRALQHGGDHVMVVTTSPPLPGPTLLLTSDIIRARLGSSALDR